jgi:hypothetical protein
MSTSAKKLSKPASEKFQMINQAYGEAVLGRNAVCHKRFAQERDS